MMIYRWVWSENVAAMLFLLDVVIAAVVSVIIYRVFFRARTAKNSQCMAIPKQTSTVSSQDIKAIAGEDVLQTQIDLARAYLELGKQALAKQILEHVMQHGSAAQKNTAQQLLVQR